MRGLSDRHPEGSVQIGMVAAFWWEVRPLLRRQLGARRLGHNLYSLFLAGQPALLAISGVGTENSSLAAQHLVNHFAPRALFSLGFAGALRDSLAPGDIVLADQIMEESTQQRFDCRTNLLPVKFTHQGRLLCAKEVVVSAVGKKRLGQRWEAVAADMESAGVARVAAGAGLPFGAVKSITDSSEQSISIDFIRCRSEHGELSLAGVLREGLRTPQGMRDLWKLGWSSRQAAGTLAAALSPA